MAPSEQERLTQLLALTPHRKDEQAVAELFLLVYDELRTLAQRYLKQEPGGHTLQPTALVHEAFLRLIDQTRVNWQGKMHFYAVCAMAMRRILVDHARARRRGKRGGGWRRMTLDPALAPGEEPDLDVLSVHEALERLAELDDRQARVVELRFFAGMSIEEVAHVLGVSKRTVEGDWTHAKAWLRAELGRGEG